MTDENNIVGAPVKDASTLHQRADALAIIGLLLALFCTICAYYTWRVAAAALDFLGINNAIYFSIAMIAIALVSILFVPAFRGFTLSRNAVAALAKGDVVQARIDTAAAREKSLITVGWSVFVLFVLAFICFVLMNEVAVGKTFFLLPLIHAKWWLVTYKFLTVNMFICIVAEIIVLIWGLIVALARLTPGLAGQPIRALATFYCDLFRGLPGIVTMYLIAFGIPTSGLSDIIMGNIVPLFKDLSMLSPQEHAAAIRVDVVWWCIISLTLTYGAYVAEVYRAGIEGIHHSQTMAARSLGLSYMQTMRHVIVPQAIRRIVAPLLNDFIGLQKDTSLVQVVGVIDAFSQAKIIAANAFNLSAVTVVAFLFVLVTIPQARFVDRVLERDNARLRAAG